jgi:hypothetical protein
MAIINRGELVVQGPVRDLLFEREQSVRIESDAPGRVAEVVGSLPYASVVFRDGTSVEARIPGDRMAEVNRLLVQLGIGVRALVPKRSLEEYFLAITEGASDVAPREKAES